MSKFKIQTAVTSGWADIKVCHNPVSPRGGVQNDEYIDDHFDTKEEAMREKRELEELSPFKGEYRVVPADTPQDEDIYN